MCGIFFVFDAGSSGSELDSKFSSIASDNLKFRGPDGVSTLSGEGRRYKACISYRLDQLEYPYHDRKIGFGGFDIHGS